MEKRDQVKGNVPQQNIPTQVHQYGYQPGKGFQPNSPGTPSAPPNTGSGVQKPKPSK